MAKEYPELTVQCRSINSGAENCLRGISSEIWRPQRFKFPRSCYTALQFQLTDTVAFIYQPNFHILNSRASLTIKPHCCISYERRCKIQ